jgi:large subunit ribosomal protein L1
MKKIKGKRLKEFYLNNDVSGLFDVEGALELLKKAPAAKFDETVEVAVNLGVDPRHADQMVRGSVALPHGTGKTVRVLAFAKGDKVQEALDAGADFAGADELEEKIQGGWLDFDRVVATPDTMGVVGKLGRILGPRGLMPNPKLGTVTFDMAKIITEIKAGQVTFRVEKKGIIHAGIGKASFSNEQLAENAKALMDTLRRLRPAAAKGVYVQKITISSTMGPGFKINPQSI